MAKLSKKTKPAFTTVGEAGSTDATTQNDSHALHEYGHTGWMISTNKGHARPERNVASSLYSRTIFGRILRQPHIKR